MERIGKEMGQDVDGMGPGGAGGAGGAEGGAGDAAGGDAKAGAGAGGASVQAAARQAEPQRWGGFAASALDGGARVARQ